MSGWRMRTAFVRCCIHSRRVCVRAPERNERTVAAGGLRDALHPSGVVVLDHAEHGCLPCRVRRGRFGVEAGGVIGEAYSVGHGKTGAAPCAAE